VGLRERVRGRVSGVRLVGRDEVGVVDRGQRRHVWLGLALGLGLGLGLG